MRHFLHRPVRSFATLAMGFCLFHGLTRAEAAPRQTVHGNVPPAITRLNLKPTGGLAADARLNLGLSLPLRNRPALTNLLHQLYDPASPNYHHFVTPEQFAEQFGPRAEDYQAVIDFAKANGFSIAKKHSNRALLMVNASVADVEKAFHLKMLVYQHPREARNFFAPDAEPSLDFALPLLAIHGLNDFARPRPASLGAAGLAGPLAGSQDGVYAGGDFRAAYVPGVTLTGAGQSVALVEFDGYFPNDIAIYEEYNGMAPAALTNIYLDSLNSFTGPGGNNLEVALDIEMVISMAPLAQVLVYEGDDQDDVLAQIAADDIAKQISCSWLFDLEENTAQTFQQFAAQGQTYFNAAGDYGAYAGEIPSPVDHPYVTSVGGTVLSTGGNGSWVSETVWNYNSTGQGAAASSGGISTTYSIPDWQKGISMTANGGSTTMRNIPDVAMTADNVFVVFDNGVVESAYGTSCASPLWAGFMALVNQQAALNGQPPIGFLNPLLYALGTSSNYAQLFHDITTGNNTNSANPTNFFAVTGYDLCAGWGTPTSNLLAALTPTAPVILQPPANQTTSLAGNVTFAPLVLGAGPLNYQWTFNRANLIGATNSTLTLNPIQAVNGGMYQLMVKNLYGAATSSVAALTIANAPIFLTAGQGNLANNAGFALQISGMTGQGNIILQASRNLRDWNSIYTNPAGFGTAQFTDTNAVNFRRRFYRAQVQPAQ